MKDKLRVVAKIILVIILSQLTACGSGFRYSSQSDYREGFEKYVLSYTGESLSSQAWSRKYYVEPNKMTVFWSNTALDSIAQLDYQLVHSEGVDLDDIFTDENIENTLFGAYSELTKHNMCSNHEESLILREYTGLLRNTEYLIKYWLKTEGQADIIEFTLVYPSQHHTEIIEISKEVFPALYKCSNSNQ